MVRRSALLAALACLLVVMTGCIAVQPKPDGTYSISLLPPSAATTITGGSTRIGGSINGGQTMANSGGKGTALSPSYPGKTLVSGPWTVVVESTDQPKRLEDGSKPSPGKKFLVVNVAIRNTGTGNALTVLPNQFALWDPANKVVDPFPTKLGIYNAQSVRPINAGMGGYTSFVYQLPAGTAVYTFELTPKQGATGSMDWYVP